MIAIYANASQQIGYGHVMRQIALIEVLLNKQHKVTLFYRDLAPQLHGKLSGMGVVLKCAVDEIALVTMLSKADILIVDDYALSNETIIQLKNTVKQLVIFDDGTYQEPLEFDLIVNPSDVVDTIHKAPRVLQGLDYRLIRSEFKSYRARERFIEKSIFISLGGTDVKMLTPELCQQLVASNDITKLVVAVSSSCSENTLTLLKRLKQHAKFELHIDYPNLARLMSEADIAITSAGGSLYELMYLGVPTIALVLVDNQSQALDSSLNNTAYQCIDFRNEQPDFANVVKQALFLLNSADKKRKLSLYGQQAIDGMAAERIIEALD